MNETKSEVKAELTASADQMLLGHYFGRRDPAHVTALTLMKLVSELREAMWGVVQLAVSDLDIDFAAYTRGRSERFMSLLYEMDFEALTQAASNDENEERRGD